MEIVTTGDHEFEEIVEKYEEEILVQEEVPEPPLTDSADTALTQVKPRYITSIFHIHRVCIYIYRESILRSQLQNSLFCSQAVRPHRTVFAP